MIPPPPSSTLFPYTTLFRSLRDRASQQGEPNMGRGAIRRQPPSAFGDCRSPRGRRQRTVPRAVVARDRKSTRLNSSHLGISYAVFCLKKKNTKQIANGYFLT